MKNFLSIGLMSGTSMDGVDAALIKTDGESAIEFLGEASLRYDSEFKLLLKAAEFAVRNYQGDLTQAAANFNLSLKAYLHDSLHYSQESSEQQIQLLTAYLKNLNYELSLKNIIRLSTEWHRQAVQKLLELTHTHAADIHYIGYHGQNVYHMPAQQMTIQLGEPEYLAETCKISVVAHFRNNDVQHGGQGAPFAPIFHHALAARDQLLPCAVVNCGGIANISLLYGNQLTDIVGFDTGPGNILLDNLIRKRTQGREHMDKNGAHGLAGKIDEHIQTLLWQKACVFADGRNYLTMPAPKSLDVSMCHLLAELNDLSLTDACANLASFTARAIAFSGEVIKRALPKVWILAGGGWYNPVIVRELTLHLQQVISSSVKILTAEQVAWKNDYIEAQLFAYFAVRSVLKKPLSLPMTTGVPEPLTGGILYNS